MPCFCKCEECINVGSSQISLLFRIFQFVSLFSTCTCVTILLEKLTYTAVLSKKIYFKKKEIKVYAKLQVLFVMHGFLCCIVLQRIFSFA